MPIMKMLLDHRCIIVMGIIIVIVVVTVMTRLAGVLDYDRALIVGEGRVLEDGSPNELLARPMGFFSALYRYHDDDE